jgi:ADP-glucose type glycogen/starch synthase
VRAQVRIGVESYAARFGRPPLGMWLPECAYYPGLDETLAESGVRYFFLETHGVLRGSTRARRGVYAPVVCPSGLAAFGRDPECSRQVWSAEHGFPGHPDYREFYRDIGFELPLDYIGPHIGPDGIRVQTGIKYHRVTGRTEHKEAYVRARAVERAEEHAATFLEWRKKQVAWLDRRLDRRPLVTALYDAELFGHWWFEGPEWIESLLRRMAKDPNEIIPVTPSEYLAEYAEGQESVPCESSWGKGGGHDIWLNGASDRFYPRLHAASRDLARLAFRHQRTTGVRRRILNQAARELLLAQSSDWAFILKTRTASEYASRRADEHLRSFAALAAAAEEGRADESFLSGLESRDNLFPDLRFEVFAERPPLPPSIIPRNPEHVAFITAEAAPYVKVGGLADVAGALPQALAGEGVRVTVILPAYRAVNRERHRIRPLLQDLSVQLGSRRVGFTVLEAAAPAPGVRVLFVEEPRYFDREGVYVDPQTGEEYADTAERFVFFTKAALEVLRALGEAVDVVHAHDHQTALAPAYLKLTHRSDPVLGLAAAVYTLHNLGYQGIYGPEVLDIAGFGRDQFHPGSSFEYHGRVNFMKIGIEFADKVNTVSEGYAREIREDEDIGAGLGAVLAARGPDFTGILNGIDVGEWNPERDASLPRPYSARDLAGKNEAKRELLARVGLDGALAAPLAGVISRLVDQKGVDLLEKALPDILSRGVRLVVLGTGLPRYERFFASAASEHPQQVAALLKFDNGLAHLIEAGADIFLMPSLYEPCGLNQMYSLRYGTIPIVRETGGLADTVADDDQTPGGGVGFSFKEYEAEALTDAVTRAVRAYQDPTRWRALQLRAMARDHSWRASAVRYFDLYRDAILNRR